MSTLLVSACRDLFDPPEWELEALTPIASTNLDFRDILDDSLLATDSNGLLRLVFEGEIFTIQADSFFEIPDTTIVESFTVPIGFPIFPGIAFINQSEETRYNLQGVQLREAIVRSGQIAAELRNTVDRPLQVTYTIPSATLNGVALRIDELVPANATLQRTVDLSGYSLDLSGINGTTVNTLSTNFVVALDSTEDTSFQLSAGDEVSVEATLQGIVPEFAKGYFGQQEVRISEEVDNEAFLEVLNGGSLDIEDITLRLEIRNAIGADIRARIEELSNRRTSTGTEVALQHSLIDSVVNLNSAVQNPNANPPIDIKKHVFQLTTANSNLDEFLENLGDKIRLDAAVELNPDGNTSGLNDFAYFDEGIAFSIDAELPLQLAGTDLVLVDTADFDFGDEDERVEELDNITGGFVRLVADNGYPFDARVQLLLLDAQNTTIDSLVVGGSVIDAAATDAQGVVTEPVRSVVLAPINQNVLDALYRTERILIRVAFTTTNQPNRVPIFDHYNIDLKLIGDFTYRVDID